MSAKSRASAKAAKIEQHTLGRIADSEASLKAEIETMTTARAVAADKADNLLLAAHAKIDELEDTVAGLRKELATIKDNLVTEMPARRGWFS